MFFKMKSFLILYSFGLCILISQVPCRAQQQRDFSPTVTGRCEKGVMTVVVTTDEPFQGVVHTRDYRRPPCLEYGNGRQNISLRISLLANSEEPDYCGVQVRKGSDDRSVPIFVRVHRTLELAEDKPYIITCGNSGFRNARNELSEVSLKFLENDKKVNELVYGRRYVLRAGTTGAEVEPYQLQIKSCYSFAPNITEVELIDQEGCPKATDVISPFSYNYSTKTADATLFSMFKFPSTNRVHIQCAVTVCKQRCHELRCGPQKIEQLPQALPRIRNTSEDSIQLLASTTAFVWEPGDYVLAAAREECTEWRFPWLIGLCICLAILLLVMLIVNIFLCSSLTCTCTKTEVVEKEPSEMEDYDPYKVGWAPSSHYGSRTSLNKPGYVSGGGSTLNSTRSVSNASDHYAIVHSRPHSRYSHISGKEPLHMNGHHRPPGSMLSNGHYSSRI